MTGTSNYTTAPTTHPKRRQTHDLRPTFPGVLRFSPVSNLVRSSGVLGWLLIASAIGVQEAPVAPAVAWNDCAPWDGAAFTIAIGQPGSKSVDAEHAWLMISIWHPAASRHAATYRFPDRDGKTGAVQYNGTAFPSVTGTVSFPRATVADEISGAFDFIAPDGRRLAGPFRGKWSPRRAMCGA